MAEVGLDKMSTFFYCITFSEVHMLWSNLCNQVVKLTT